MTATQIDYYGRALVYLTAQEDLVRLAIAHNPYSDNKMKAGRLGRELKRLMRDAERGYDAAQQPATAADVEQMIGRMASVFGPVKRIQLSPDEFKAKMAGSGAVKMAPR
jgi:hypothetical protein